MISLIVIVVLIVAAIIVSWCVFVSPDNPYPNRPGFTEVWNRQNAWQKRRMKRTLAIIGPENRQTISLSIKPLRKRCLLLDYGTDSRVSFIREDENKLYIRYFFPTEALRITKEKQVSVLSDESDLQEILMHIPGEHHGDKLWNLCRLLELDTWGEFNRLGYHSFSGATQAISSIYTVLDEKSAMYGMLSYNKTVRMAESSYIDTVNKALPVLVSMPHY